MALFTTTCFWQPLPTDVLLSHHTDLINSTSPAHLLKDINLQPLLDLVSEYNASISSPSASSSTTSEFAPTATRTAPARPFTTLLPRCWCDLPFTWLTYDTAALIREKRREATSTPSQLAVSHRNWQFLEPFDQKQWEEMSLVKQARDVVRRKEAEAGVTRRDEEEAARDSMEEDEAQAQTPTPAKEPGATETLRRIWRALSPIFSKQERDRLRELNSQAPDSVTQHISSSTAVPAPTEANPRESAVPFGPELPPPFDYSLVLLAWQFVPFKSFWRRLLLFAIEASQKQCDLRQYGLGVVVDFGWAHQRA